MSTYGIFEKVNKIKIPKEKIERKSNGVQIFINIKLQIYLVLVKMTVLGACLTYCYETAVKNVHTFSVVPSMIDNN